MTYFSHLTVYKYNGKKLKVDYSTIPVEEKVWGKGYTPLEVKSLVSNETISLRKSKRIKNRKEVCASHSHHDEIYKITLVSRMDILDENEIIDFLNELFNYHFWYKFKYRKFLQSKLKSLKS